MARSSSTAWIPPSVSAPAKRTTTLFERSLLHRFPLYPLEFTKMKLSRFLSGLAPALAIAALVGFAAPSPTLAQQASPTPAPSAAPAPAASVTPAPPATPAPDAAAPAAAAAKPAPPAPPACSAAVGAVDATDKY